MNSVKAKFASRSDEQLAGADAAPTNNARIAHLEQAFRFAGQAVEARTNERVIEPAD
jgi:hypothetical protein